MANLGCCEDLPKDNCIFTLYVVHCVRVALTGTIVAEFWACGSLVGIGLSIFSYSVFNVWTLGAPLLLLCNGATFWQCNQGYLFDPVADHVIFSLGLFSDSISAQCTRRHCTARRGCNTVHFFQWNAFHHTTLHPHNVSSFYSNIVQYRFPHSTLCIYYSKIRRKDLTYVPYLPTHRLHNTHL